jgi:hypothetical protein
MEGISLTIRRDFSPNQETSGNTLLMEGISLTIRRDFSPNQETLGNTLLLEGISLTIRRHQVTLYSWREFLSQSEGIFPWVRWDLTSSLDGIPLSQIGFSSGFRWDLSFWVTWSFLPDYRR